ncbi:MAG: metallophosphoesterase [Anaerolineae bacterium]
MRILAVSDETNTPLYNAGVLRQRAGDAQLIISCGDLPATYLDFIASVLCQPLLYVRGNHFWQDSRQGERLHGRNLDNRVVRERGLLIGGLEGSMRYKPGAAQYTDGEMWAKFVGMMPRLVLNRLVHGRALDILVTHAAPFGVHDRPDLTHQGFRAFLRLMEWFKPKYLLHGHIHVWDMGETTLTRYLQTLVVNVYPWRIIDVDDAPVARAQSVKR